MRMYIQPSWTDAAQDHDLWSGGNGQYRGDRSVDLSTFDKNGRARMEAFSDDAVEALKCKNKPKISVADKILPQQKRVITLTNQMRELVSDYKAGLYTIEEYSLLLDVLTAKKERSEELLQKARCLKPKSAQESAQHSPLASSPIHPEKPVQIAANRVNKACQSAKNDLVYYTSAVVGVFTAFMWFTH